MKLKGVRIGFGFTGAWCVFDKVLPQLKVLVAEGAQVIPIVSHQVAVINSRYGEAETFLNQMKEFTGNDVITTVSDSEAYNKFQTPLDILIIAPATGSTLSKLSSGSCDTPVLMMAKEIFRNNKPVVVGIATNDGLAIGARSIGSLLSTKNVFFIPFGQDNFIEKPNSLVAKFDKTLDTVQEALKKEQIQPVLEKPEPSNT